MNIKKLSLSFLVLTLFFRLEAQEESFEGSYITGGFISVSISKNDESIPAILLSGTNIVYASQVTNSQSVNFYPYIGKEINRHWVLGSQLRLSFGNSKSKREEIPGYISALNHRINSFSFGINIFSRYSFNPDNKLVFYLQPSIGFLKTNSKTRQNAETINDRKSNSASIGSSVGFLYNINDKWRATLRFGGISYQRGKLSYTEPDELDRKFDDFDISMNLSGISFGFELKF